MTIKWQYALNIIIFLHCQHVPYFMHFDFVHVLNGMYQEGSMHLVINVLLNNGVWEWSLNRFQLGGVS